VLNIETVDSVSPEIKRGYKRIILMMSRRMGGIIKEVKRITARLACRA
jgi:hypothetical protein